MRCVVLFLVCLTLSGCAKIERAFEDRAARAAASQATAHENPAPPPTFVSYIAHVPDGSNKELTAAFSGDGRARLMWAGTEGKTRIVLDYKKGTQTSSPPPEDHTQATTAPIDAVKVPPFYDSLGATAYGARCTGDGILKGHEYHRWIKTDGVTEIEVWTDDEGAFPCYFRSGNRSGITEWTMQSAWVDESLKDKADFF